MSSRFLSLRCALLASVVVVLWNALGVLFECYAIQPYGSSAVLFFYELLTLPAVGLAVALVAGRLGLSIKGKDAAIVIAVVGPVFILSLGFGLKLRERVLVNSLAQLADRFQPLIAGIAHYEESVGSVPDSLESLVPEYIDRYPRTQMGGYPDIEFWTDPLARKEFGDQWAIVVELSSGLFAFDRFVYLPGGDYSSCYAGVERLGEWAYLRY